jgi:hypothetical protein
VGRVGLEWATLPVDLGRLQKIPKKMSQVAEILWAEIDKEGKWVVETFFEFKQGFWFKNQRIQIFSNWI